MVQAQTEGVEMDSLLAEELEDTLVNGVQPLERDLTLGRCRLIRDAHQGKPRLRQLPRRHRRALDQAHVRGPQRRLRDAGGARHKLVERPVAIEERGRPAAHGLASSVSDSQWPCLTARTGCETNACQTTA